VLPGCGSDSANSQSQPSDRSPVQHHMKETIKAIKKAFCKALKQKQTILLKNESKTISKCVKQYKK